MFNPDATAHTPKPGEILSACGELQRTTIGDLTELPGSRLSWDFHRPNQGTMRALGKLKADDKLTSKPGEFVSSYLSMVLSRLGDDDMGPVERDAAKVRKVAQLPAGDVLTLLVLWTHHRTRRRGAALPSGHGCASCGQAFERIRVDLAELEVLHHLAPVDQQWATVGLWDGFPIGEEQVMAVRVRAPSWGGSLGGLPASGWRNDEEIHGATLRDSLCGAVGDVSEAVGEMRMFPMSVVDELMPDDVDLIDRAVEDLTGSVDMTINVQCPGCGHRNQTVFDWQRVGFSKASPRS